MIAFEGDERPRAQDLLDRLEQPRVHVTAAAVTEFTLGRVRPDPSDFRVKHEPGHPNADENGNVKYPNVNALVEMTTRLGDLGLSEPFSPNWC